MASSSSSSSSFSFAVSFASSSFSFASSSSSSSSSFPLKNFFSDERFGLGRVIHSGLVRVTERSKIALVFFSRNCASATWCLLELVEMFEFMEKNNLKVLPIFRVCAKHEERFKDSKEDVNLWKLDGSTNRNLPLRYDVTPDESDDADDDAGEVVQDYVADLPRIGLENESLYNLSNGEVQLIHEFIESLSNLMPEDGSTNWNLPPRFDVTPDESDDADEMVQDYVADLPLIGLENKSLSNPSIQMLEDGSDNLDLPDEADNDADEMVQDYVADLPLIGLENESLSNLSKGEVQLITNFFESLSNLCIQMLEFDNSQGEADNDADEMVQDYVADSPLIGLENLLLSGFRKREVQLITIFLKSVFNLSIQMLEDGSDNLDLPPRFGNSQDEADNDADEMVQDYVADLPRIGLENESLSNLSNGEVQLITNFVESLSNLSIQMLEDGSDNLYLPPRFDNSQDEADNDADEMVQDYVADLPLIGLENESLSNLSIQMLEDGSDNLDLPPRFDDSQDEADNDVDEMVQDYVADLPLEVHVVPDDVADVPQEARVVEDRVANLPQEAHVVEDHVANLQQVCAICVTNVKDMAFRCGHRTCVECGERLDRCPICRAPIVDRIRLFD